MGRFAGAFPAGLGAGRAKLVVRAALSCQVCGLLMTSVPGRRVELPSAWQGWNPGGGEETLLSSPPWEAKAAVKVQLWGKTKVSKSPLDSPQAGISGPVQNPPSGPF